MPSIAAHMVVAKLVGEKLNIYNPEFIRGNLLPDVINIEDSHHKIKGVRHNIPDIEYFKNNLDLSNELYLGYYVHLLLDKYYLDDYIPTHVDNKDIFKDKTIYKDYCKVNPLLINKFELDIEYLKEVLSNYEQDIIEEKLNDNINYLMSTYTADTTYLKFDEFSTFLSDISDTIYEEIKQYVSKKKLVIK